MVMGYDVKIEMGKEPISAQLVVIIRRAMQLTQMELVRNLKINSPVDHGKLQGSWFPVWNNQTMIRAVRSAAKYASWVNDGTGIYGPRGEIIKPKLGRLLGPFMYNGRKIAVPWIRGQKPQHFVEKSIAQTERRTDEFVIRATMEQGGT